MKNEKIKLEFEVEKKDYVMMHKAEIRSISSEDKILGMVLFCMDKIGAVTLGIFVQKFLEKGYISNNSQPYLAIAIITFCVALYAFYQKQKNIEIILEEKRKELED